MLTGLSLELPSPQIDSYEFLFVHFGDFYNYQNDQWQFGDYINFKKNLPYIAKNYQWYE